MKILQFYFNYKQKRKDLFKSFCLAPSNKKEEKLGYFGLIVELKKAERKDKKFLKKFAKALKDEYYLDPKRSLENSFNSTLFRANRILKKKFKKQGLEWQEKLNSAVFAIGSDFSAAFSRLGNTRIFLLRNGEIFDSGENLNSQNSGFKEFSKTAIGKLAEGDRILFLNQDLFNQFWQNKFFSELKKVKTAKELKRFFRKRKEIIKQFQGVLVFIFVRKFRRKIYLALPKISWPKKILLSLPTELSKKNLIKILILILLLLLGWLIF